MKHFLLIVVTVTALLCTASCSTNDRPISVLAATSDTSHQTLNTMKITIGETVFKAGLNDNATVKALKAMLPMTVVMHELNANEKYFYFSSSLPTHATPGGNIQAGDLMLYGNNCLVLFYENFNTSYSYTRLGKLENSNELKAVLGKGNVTVKFELP
jgi:hypothetical protein